MGDPVDQRGGVALNVDSPRVLSLFAGIGGLDLAVRLAIPAARVVGYVEWDAYASSVLLGRMEDSALEPAPIFCGDVRHLDGREFCGRVDLITAGFPCTDISLAGRREGIEGDASGLWAEVVRLADETGAPYLFLENVAAIRSARGRAVGDTPGDVIRALGTVLADLAALGFDAEWLCLRASDVGAPHGRDRWFCLAHRLRERSQGLFQDGTAALPTGRSDRATLADASDDHRGSGERGEETGTRENGERRRGSASRSDSFPLGPSDLDAWRAILADSPWLAPAIESGLRRVVDGLPRLVDASRADRLRCLGNAVVPLQAAAAFAELFRRLDHGRVKEVNP